MRLLGAPNFCSTDTCAFQLRRVSEFPGNRFPISFSCVFVVNQTSHLTCQIDYDLSFVYVCNENVCRETAKPSYVTIEYLRRCYELRNHTGASILI